MMLQTSHSVEFTVISINDLKLVHCRIEVVYLKYLFYQPLKYAPGPSVPLATPSPPLPPQIHYCWWIPPHLCLINSTTNMIMQTSNIGTSLAPLDLGTSVEYVGKGCCKNVKQLLMCVDINTVIKEIFLFLQV